MKQGSNFVDFQDRLLWTNPVNLRIFLRYQTKHEVQQFVVFQLDLDELTYYWYMIEYDLRQQKIIIIIFTQ